MITVVIPLVVGSVLLVVSGFIWVARRETVEQAGRIVSLKLVPLDAVALGELTAVRGEVVGRGEDEAPIVDPVTGEDAVRVEALVARVDRGEEVLHRVDEGKRLRLEDEGGVAEVELLGALLSVEPRELERSEGEPSEKMKAILRDAGVDLPEPDRNARYVLVHRALNVGAKLTVIGVPRASEQKATRGAGYRGDAGPIPVFAQAAGPLFVSPDPLEVMQSRESEDVRAMSTMLRLASFVGLALVLAAAFFLTRP